MKNSLKISLVAGLILLGNASSVQAQDYLQKALAAKQSGPIYSYDLQYISPEFRAKAHVFPSRDKGKRIQIISPPKSKWNSEQRKAATEVDKEASEAFWCHSLAKRIPTGGSRLLSETADTATYRFKPLPEANNSDDAKIMKHLVGTVTVDKKRPAILGLSLRAPEPFKPAFVATVKKFNLDVSCARTPDGRTYVRRFDLNVFGSAMMRKFTERETRIHSNLKRTAN